MTTFLKDISVLFDQLDFHMYRSNHQHLMSGLSVCHTAIQLDMCTAAGGVMKEKRNQTNTSPEERSTYTSASCCQRDGWPRFFFFLRVVVHSLFGSSHNQSECYIDAFRIISPPQYIYNLYQAFGITRKKKSVVHVQ